MRSITKTRVAIVVLLQATLSATLAAGPVWRAFGLSFQYPPGWPTALGFLALGSVVLMVAVRFGVWQVLLGRRGSGFLLAAFICYLLGVAALSAVRAVPAAQSGVIFDALRTTNLWLTLVGGLLFAGGLLLSGSVARWVAWLGLAEVAFSIPNSLMMGITNSLLFNGSPASAVLGGLVSALDVAFLVALGLSLIAVRAPHAPSLGTESTLHH